MLVDIIEDEDGLKEVEKGLVRSISKGLYEQGVSFKVDKVSFNQIASMLLVC
jgi:hypothetical protein